MEWALIIMVLLILAGLISERLNGPDINLVLNNDRDIVVFDKDGIVCTISGRLIDWDRKTNLENTIRIKEISDNFNEYVRNLKREEND